MNAAATTVIVVALDGVSKISGRADAARGDHCPQARISVGGGALSTTTTTTRLALQRGRRAGAGVAGDARTRGAHRPRGLVGLGRQRWRPVYRNRCLILMHWALQLNHRHSAITVIPG